MFGFKHHSKATRTQCQHDKAIPRWDKIEDTGNPHRISGLYCPGCDQFLPPPATQHGPQAAPSSPPA